MTDSLATVILSAGKGTRMKSDLPKVLHPLAGKPLINHVIETALAIGSERIICIVGYKREQVIESVERDFPFKVEFVTQDPQLGTAHAVLQARDLLKKHQGQVLVLSGDVPLIKAETLNQMIKSHKNSKVTLMTTIANDPTGYGRIVRNPFSNNMLLSMVEEKDIGDHPEIRAIKEVNCGIYLFDSMSLFHYLPKVDNNNNQKEYYLPKVIILMLQDGHRVNTYQNPEMAETHGVNTKEQLEELEKSLRRGF